MKTNTYVLVIATAVSTLVAGCQIPEIEIPLPDIEIAFPWFPDLDGDGFGDMNGFDFVLSPTDPSDGTTTYVPIMNWGDCDDANIEVHPDATEVLDDIDNDCDGKIDNVPYWYADTDTDGYGNPGVSLQQNTQPNGYVADDTDCNDIDAAISPAATELIDGIDNNCNGEVDDVPTWYADTDEDGFGDPAVSQEHHLQPVGFVLDNTDCNDTNSAINPGATDSAKVLDYIDNDCDGKVDEQYYIGDTGPAGGIVFWLNEMGEHGLEAAPEDQDDGTGAEWGCYNKVAGASGVDGALDTDKILAAGCTSELDDDPIAAELASNYSLNGYDDWFLPTRFQMVALYNNKDIVGGINTSASYWSSSEGNNGYNKLYVATVVPISNNDYPRYDYSKYKHNKVRAVRAF